MGRGDWGVADDVSGNPTDTRHAKSCQAVLPEVILTGLPVCEEPEAAEVIQQGEWLRR